MTTAEADWYPDPRTPEGDNLRYWDGTSWTEQVRDASAAPGPMPADPAPSTSGRSVPRLGLRRFARDLVTENGLLWADNDRLRRAVQRFGLEDAVERTIALDDLDAEIGVQQARLEGLLAHVRSLELSLMADQPYAF